MKNKTYSIISDQTGEKVDSMDEAGFNRHLASLELYETLIEAIQDLEEGCYSYSVGTKARVAINKAEGK